MERGTKTERDRERMEREGEREVPGDILEQEHFQINLLHLLITKSFTRIFKL